MVQIFERPHNFCNLVAQLWMEKRKISSQHLKPAAHGRLLNMHCNCYLWQVELTKFSHVRVIFMVSWSSFVTCRPIWSMFHIGLNVINDKGTVNVVHIRDFLAQTCHELQVGMQSKIHPCAVSLMIERIPKKFSHLFTIAPRNTI